MSGPLSVVFVPGGVDVEAGLAALDAVDDAVLLERAHLGLLGWGWDIPFVESPEPPWADDHELLDAELAGAIPEALQQRYLVAVRESLAAGIRNAATLLAGEHSWFDSFIAMRVPLASGGQMVVFGEGRDGTGGSEAPMLSDVARLPVDVLPEVGRAMGVHGPEAVAIHVTFEGRAAGG